MIKRLLVAKIKWKLLVALLKTLLLKMGIFTIAVYSEADTNSLHVKMADKAIYIGPSPANQSYLNRKRIMEAIELSRGGCGTSWLWIFIRKR